MTDKYKERLIQYVTNNQELSDEVYTVFADIETRTGGYYGSYDIVKESSIDTSIGTNFFTYIATLLLETDRSNIRINGLLQINNSNIKVIYGGYSKTDSVTSEGFLILLDGDYNAVAMLREYESGTIIREVQFLAQDENNNIYGVVGDTTQEEAKYFTMLNNFAMPTNGEYSLSLRKNYSLSDEYFRCIDITKKDGESEYLMVGCDIIGANGLYYNYGARGIDLQINVGSSNVWTRLYTRSTFPGYACFGIYSEYNDDGDPLIKVVAEIPSTSHYTGTCYLYTNENGTTSSAQLFNYSDIYLDNSVYKIRQTKDNDGGFYFQVNGYYISDPTTYWFGLAHIDESDNLNYIMALNGTSVSYAWTIINNGWYDDNNVGRPFLIQHAAQETTDDDGNTVVLVDMGGVALEDYDTPATTMHNICNTILYPSYDFDDFANQLNILSTRDYNLLSIFTIQSDLTTDSPANVITVLKRPGLQVNDQFTYDTFQPKYVDIISDDEIKFSRNIYDSVVYSNVSVDSVQVPYNYLNDMDIEGQNLYGVRNLEFVEDTMEWNKNRYENMDINFINKINVSNRDTSENLLSQAVNLNSTIHGSLTINGGTASILLADGSEDIVSVEWKALTQYTYQATITVTETEDITGIDWSNSLNGIEFTTTFDEELEAGTYTFKQKVTINDEFYKTGLMYNDEQVQYNSEDVYAQSEEE